MKINSNTSYPYPIWGWKDDYKSTINDEDILITEISDKDNFVYELELRAQNEDIKNSLSKGKPSMRVWVFVRQHSITTTLPVRMLNSQSPFPVKK